MTTPSRNGIVPWPDELQTAYREAGYWQDTLLTQKIWAQADETPDHIAIFDAADDTTISYRDLIRRADSAAGALLEQGLQRDDRVMVVLPNGWQFIVFLLACFRAGIIPVMALPAHRAFELRFLGQLAEIRAFIAADEIKGFDYQRLIDEIKPDIDSFRHGIISGDNRDNNLRLEELLKISDDAETLRKYFDENPPEPSSPAMFLLSGGTTGLPKLIVRTHNDYDYNIRATTAVSNFNENTVCLASMPMSHNFPLGCPGVLGALYLGAKVVSTPTPRPEKVFDLIEQHQVTDSAVVPAVAQRWIEYEEENHTGKLNSLEVLQVGGSRMPDELARRVSPILGATLQQVFGMAEGLINMTRLDDDEETIVTTQGRPVAEADEVRVVDPFLVDVPDGEPGSILTRGPYTPRGYYAAPEANAKSFVEDGWYSPGDIVIRQTDGNLVVHGRDKDMINRGGEKISAEEIESLIYEIPGVRLVAAVSMPDEQLGERVCIYVQQAQDAQLSLESIRQHLNTVGIAPFKLPEKLVLVDDIPVTKIGKIDKKALREDIRERLAAASETADSN